MSTGEDDFKIPPTFDESNLDEAVEKCTSFSSKVKELVNANSYIF